jgi:ubiquinone/menaquinone biosynthesis C-methylase UbiE
MADNVTNLFVHQSVAKRYASDRPYFHPLVASKISAFTGVNRFGHALDVACDTGQSACAVADIADAMEAIDISPEIANVESGSVPLADAAAWIAEGIEPFFGGQVRTLKFGGSIWYLRPAP